MVPLLVTVELLRVNCTAPLFLFTVPWLFRFADQESVGVSQPLRSMMPPVRLLNREGEPDGNRLPLCMVHVPLLFTVPLRDRLLVGLKVPMLPVARFSTAVLPMKPPVQVKVPPLARSIVPGPLMLAPLN